MIPNPCKPDCPRRSATCHGNCPDYADFRRAKDEYNQKVYKAKQEQNLKFSRTENKHARLDKKYW